MRPVTLDASVLVDAYAGRERKEKSLKLLGILSTHNAQLVEPRLLVVELAGVLIRYIERREVEKALELIQGIATLVPEEEIWGIARQVALRTGARAADAYYIATTIHEDSILITSDKHQHESAARIGAKSFYLPKAALEEIEKAIAMP